MLKIIVPAYNEGPYIRKNILAIRKVLDGAGIEHGFFLVDDGSHDETWAEICRLRQEEKNIEAIRFSRNFGKEPALAAALDTVDADGVVIMDSDLQHPPRYIPKMVELWRDGFEVIDGVKSDRGKESLIYKLFSLFFYKAFCRSSGIDLSSASDFKLLDRKVIDAWRLFPEKSTFFRGMSALTGFKRAVLPFAVDERSGGTSRWTVKKLISLAVGSIVSYTSLPLFLSFAAAILCGAASLTMAVLAIVLKNPLFTLLFAIFFTGGLILASIGILGIYLSKAYDEIKARPRYIIAEKI